MSKQMFTRKNKTFVISTVSSIVTFCKRVIVRSQKGH